MELTQAKLLLKIDILKRIALIFLGAIIVLPRILPFPPLYIIPDEMPISRWTSQMTQALLAGDWEGTANNAYPAITLAWLELPQLQIMRLFSGDTSAVEMLAEKDDAFFAALPRRRFGLALINSIAVLAAFWLLRQLYNNFIAVTATLLIALDPFLLTQARAFRTEGLVTSFMLLSVLTLLLYMQRQQHSWLVISAVMAGLAMLTKITAAYLFLFTVLTLLVWLILSGKPRNFSKALLDMAGWGLVTTLIFVIFWPVLWTSPAEAFRLIYNYLERVGTDSSEIWNGVLFFQGRLVAGDPGISFYLWYLLYRITPTVGVGLVALLGYTLILLWRWLYPSPIVYLTGQPDISQQSRALHSLFSRETYLVTGLILAYAFFYFIAMNLGATKVDRYLIPIFPALSILAAVGFQLLLSLSFYPTYNTIKASVLGVMIFISSAVWALPHHPYYFSYWNPLLGGGRQAVKIIPVGDLQGTDVLLTYMNSLPDAHELKLSGPNIRYCSQVFVGECRGLNDFLDSDYFITDISSVQNRVYLTNPQTPVPNDELANTDIQAIIPDAELILKYTQAGLDYAWLYKMPAGLQNVGQSLQPHGIFKGYQLATPTAGAGDRLKISLFWQNGAEGWTLKDSEFFVKLFDEGGQLLQVVPAQLAQEFKPHLSRPNKHLVFTAPFTIPSDAPLGVYPIEIGLRIKATGEETWHFSLVEPANTITINRGGRQISPEALSIQYPLHYTLDETGLTLLGYTDQTGDEQFPHLNLSWHTDTALDQEYLLRLNLVDHQGQTVAAWVRPLASAIHPLTEWQAGETVTLRFPLALGYELPTNTYQPILSLLPADSSTAQPVDTVFLTPFAGSAALQPPDMAMQHQLRATLGQYLDLLGYDLKVKQEEASGTLFVSLYWLNRNLADSTEVEVQLLDERQEIIAQQVQPILASTDPTSWHSTIHYQFSLVEVPATIVIKIPAKETEQQPQIQVPGQQIVIGDIVNKIAPVVP